MSTLNINNYENHRPHSQIYQNMEIVPEASPDRKMLVIIGSSDGQMPEAYRSAGLVQIGSTADINKKLLPEGEGVKPSDSNLLYKASQIALSAGGSQAFYVLDVEDTTAVIPLDNPEPGYKTSFTNGSDFEFTETVEVTGGDTTTKTYSVSKPSLTLTTTTSDNVTSASKAVVRGTAVNKADKTDTKTFILSINSFSTTAALSGSTIVLGETTYNITASSEGSFENSQSRIDGTGTDVVYDPSKSLYYLYYEGGCSISDTLSDFSTVSFENVVTDNDVTTTKSISITDKDVLSWSVNTFILNDDDNVAAVKAAWEASLKYLKNTDRSMFVCPLTYNQEISNLVKQTCTNISTPDEQKWKRCYQGVPACAEGDDVELAGKSGAALVEAVIESNRRYNLLGEEVNQRCANIWTAGSKIYTTDENGAVVSETLPNMMVAAGVASLRASLLVQQGLSMKTLPWIAGIPSNYKFFDKEELNKIAVSNSQGVGTMIIAQDDADNEVYVRHQLTADLTRGIMYYEDSVGVNVDSICYGIKDIVKPYIGQRNNNAETLVEIRNRVTDYLLELTNVGVSIEDRKIGPQIKAVDLESIIVELDGDLKDRVNIQFDIEIPLPINTIKVHVNAYADLNNR